MLLLPLDDNIRIVELDANIKNNEYSEGKSLLAKNRRKTTTKWTVKRYSHNIRVWVQFESVRTAALACQRSGECIHVTVPCETKLTKNDHVTQNSDSDDDDSSSTTSSSSSSSSTTDDEFGFAIERRGKPRKLIDRECQVSIAITPIRKKHMARYVMKNIAIDVRQFVHRTERPIEKSTTTTRNDTPLATIAQWIQQDLSPNISKILWTSTIHHLKLTANTVDNDEDEDGEIKKVTVSNFLFPLMYEQWLDEKIGDKRQSNDFDNSDDEQLLGSFNTHLQRTLDGIETQNESLLILSVDPTITNPILMLTCNACKALQEQIEYVKHKLLKLRRWAIFGNNNTSFYSN
jgi:hypothetical protein